MRSTSVRKLQQWAKETHGDGELPVLVEKLATMAAVPDLLHDRGNRGDSERTGAMTDPVVDDLHQPQAEAVEVRWGAFLHDQAAPSPAKQPWAVALAGPGQVGHLGEEGETMARRHSAAAEPRRVSRAWRAGSCR